MPALAFGTAVTFGSVVVYLLLLGEWPWQWSVERLTDTLRGMDAQGQWAFGQLFSGFVGIFLAGTLGFFAVKEFASNQEEPRLELMFYSPEAELLNEWVINSETEHDGRAKFAVAVHNRGPVIARWYTLQIFLPFLSQYPHSITEPFVTQVGGGFLHIPPFTPVVGRTESLKVGRQGSEWLLRFFSLGEDVCYPSDPLVLFTFDIPVAVIAEAGYAFQCRYHINTDRGKPVVGAIRLLLQQPKDLEAVGQGR